MRKIIIFYGTYGGGHLSAARAINEYIINNYKNIEVQMFDCVEYVNKFFNKVSTGAYAKLARKAPKTWGFVYKKAEKGAMSKISNASNRLMAIKLNKLLQEEMPDIVISTHPFSSNMCALLKKKQKATFKLATVMTDFAAHNQWLQYADKVDYFFVAHDSMKQELIHRGIDGNKIHATGIPLSSRYLEHFDRKSVLKEFKLEEGKKTVLFFAGGEFGLGKASIFTILKTLAENFENLQIVASSGRNEKIKERFSNIVSEAERTDSIKVIGFTNKMPELLSIADVIITKPGGLTTTESLASNLPMIIINPIPGQEEENAEFLEKNGAAVWLKDDNKIDEILRSILDNPEKMQKMKINANLLAKRNSTKDICKIILGE